MKIADVKIKNGISKKIEHQNTYRFLCPEDLEVDIGDYVLVDTKQGNKEYHNENFRVAKILALKEVDFEELISDKSQVKPYRYVVARLSEKNFDRRCINTTKIRAKLFDSYQKIDQLSRMRTKKNNTIIKSKNGGNKKFKIK